MTASITLGSSGTERKKLAYKGKCKGSKGKKKKQQEKHYTL